MGIPYTYRITHLPSGKHYYGARYAKDCHPSDLWVKYFTSSKTVKKLIEQDGEDAFFVEVRKVFNDVESCVDWERKVLVRLKVTTNNHWLNMTISNFGDVAYGHLPKAKAKRVETNLGKFGCEYPMMNDDVKAKAELTFIERYGAKTYLCSDEGISKIENVMLERYGVKHNFDMPGFRDRAKVTLIDRYGVDSPMKSEEFVSKSKTTSLERYGVDHPMKCKEISDSVRNAFVEKYGAENIEGCKLVTDKRTKTLIDRYGVTTPMKVPGAKEKSQETCMTRYGASSFLASENGLAKTRDCMISSFGYDNPLKSPEIHQRQKTTMLEVYGHEYPLQNPEILSRAKINMRYDKLITCDRCGYVSDVKGIMLSQHFNKCSWIPILCVETGDTFENSQRLLSWLKSIKPNIKNIRQVRDVCTGKKGVTAFGFHWKFVDTAH